MRFTTTWWTAFRVESFKAAAINLQVRGTLLIRIQNGCQSAYNPKTADLQMTIGLLPFVVDSVKPCTDWWWPKQNRFNHLRMCCVRTRSKREASSQNLTQKTSHMLNVPYNFLNGFELISKMIRGTSQLAEICRSAEKSHVWQTMQVIYFPVILSCISAFIST